MITRTETKKKGKMPRLIDEDALMLGKKTKPDNLLPIQPLIDQTALLIK